MRGFVLDSSDRVQPILPGGTEECLGGAVMGLTLEVDRPRQLKEVDSYWLARELRIADDLYEFNPQFRRKFDAVGGPVYNLNRVRPERLVIRPALWLLRLVSRYASGLIRFS